MGFTHWDNDWSWRGAYVIQAAFPAFVCATIFFLCPESPRYLIMKGHREKARKMISMYFTSSDDINHPFVDMMVAQIDESIENSAIGFRATWDFRIFFKRETAFRTFILLLYSLFQSWNGGKFTVCFETAAMLTFRD